MKKILFGAIGVAVMAAGTAHADVFSDNFDTWQSIPTGSFLTYNGGATVNGWTVGKTSIDLVNNPWPNCPAGTTYWVDLAGTPGPGSIGRTLTGLNIGTTYDLTFGAFSNDGYADNNGNAIFARLGGSTMGVAANTLSGASYTPESLMWTATSSSATLYFGTRDPSNGNTGIDHVDVRAVPEPCSMLALGGAALGLIRRRRNSN